MWARPTRPEDKPGAALMAAAPARAPFYVDARGCMPVAFRAARGSAEGMICLSEGPSMT